MSSGVIGDAGRPPAELTDLPSDVRERCLDLMHELGLVFGCIDLIVTPENEYVFLEVNEMGQFLWVEHCCPESKLLHKFSQFLMSRDPKFDYDDKSPAQQHVSLSQYRKVYNKGKLALEHQERQHLFRSPGLPVSIESSIVPSTAQNVTYRRVR